MTATFFKKTSLLIIFAAATMALRAQTWQDDFAKMPLTEKVSELNGGNCARVLLNSFKRNSSTQALILMPGATDELYFFRRVHARLTNAAPTMLDAIAALTNQTYIETTFEPPLLLLHTVEDPLDPIIVVHDERTAERIRKHHFEKHAVFEDRDWDHVQPDLAFDLNTKVLPGLRSHDSHHFFRHSLAEYDLNGWDALRALALAGKTQVTIQRKLIVFQGDTRYGGPPPHLEDFLPDKSSPAKPASNPAAR
jgi:hypothetical protein